MYGAMIGSFVHLLLLLVPLHHHITSGDEGDLHPLEILSIFFSDFACYVQLSPL